MLFGRGRAVIRAWRLYSPAIEMWRQFDRTQRQADLEKAIEGLRAASRTAPPGHEDLARMNWTLATACLTHHSLTGARASLDEAILASQTALFVPPPVRIHGEVIAVFSNALERRYAEDGSAQDIEQLVKVRRLQLEIGGDLYTEMAAKSDLADALSLRFDQARSRSDLDEAILLRQAVLFAAEKHDRFGVTRQAVRLATDARKRHSLSGTGSDLNLAAVALRRVVEWDDLDVDNPGLATAHLADVLAEQALWDGHENCLDDAIEHARRAVEMTRWDPRFHAERLHMLAKHLRARFDQNGRVVDLDDAIAAGHRALPRTGPEDEEHAERALHLGLDLARRSQVTGELTDLDKAIACCETASHVVTDHVELRLTLATLYSTRYSNTRQAADRAAAAQAAVHARSCLTTTEARSKYEPLLGEMLFTQVEHTGELDQLDEAIALLSGYTTRSWRSCRKLISALVFRFDRTGARSDLNWALDLAQHWHTEASHDETRAPTLTYGQLLRRRYELDGDRRDLEKATAMAMAAAKAADTPSLLEATMCAADWAIELGDWTQATDAVVFGIYQLRKASAPDLHRDSLEFWLTRAAGLASDATQCAIRAGKPNLALELAERGRAILLTEALGYRAETARLADRDPGLAERFTEEHYKAARQETSQITALGNDARVFSVISAELARRRPPGADAARKRRDLDKLTATVAKIRQLPGFARFPLPSDPGNLLENAKQGPVVLLNSSRYGASALILTTDGLVTVPLPDADSTKVEAVLARLRGKKTKELQPVLSETLKWLWQAVTGPVLHELGITEPPLDNGVPPRVWWIPTGLLAHLPVHAAQGPQHNTLDLVVASYASTIGTLRDFRSKPAPDGELAALAVAMSRTPGEIDLSEAETEARQMAAHFDDNTILSGSTATKEAVTDGLRHANIAHFACHTDIRTESPFSSTLLLDDHSRNPLTVADIAEQRYPAAELAYLSSCQTAEPSPRLLDSGIHLVHAFQSAGFRHVIGTLWPVHDQPGALAAQCFYENLAKPGIEPAEALRQSCQTVRSEYPSFPALWSAYIHAGP